jgi:RimJ/RimL family protein N-acetyltransferase
VSSSTTTRIEGPEVYLEIPGPEQLPTIWKVYLDAPDYFEALTGSPDFDPSDIEMVYEEAIADDARYYFAVRRTDNKALIGTLEVEVGSEEVPSILRGLVLAQAERGRGYGRAALDLIERFLVDEHGATALTAEVPGGYDDGERFLAAVGFRERRLKSGEIRWLKRLDSE